MFERNTGTINIMPEKHIVAQKFQNIVSYAWCISPNKFPSVHVFDE